MPILAQGQFSVVDLSDGKSLTCYLTSNQPKVQVNDQNPGGSIVPSWTGVPYLLITPVLYLNQTAVALNAAGLTITWKRKEGSSAETNLTTGETVAANILTVNQNKLTAISSGMLTYLAYVAYLDPDTGLPVNATADITYTLVNTGINAKDVFITGEQVFKYDAVGAVTPAQITLTATVANVTLTKWQYKNASSAWVDYPTTGDNANITSATLNVKPTHACFVGDAATLRVVTSDANIGDVFSLAKVRDGTAGGSGTAASTVLLSNPSFNLAGNVSGQVSAQTVTCNVIAYTGITKVTPTVGTTTGMPTGMTVALGTVANNEQPLTITIAANATLGGAGNLNGTLTVPITAPIATSLLITWAKVNTGATGAAGASAVVFSLYTPNGNVFVNQGGTLTIQTQAYSGATVISSGATYAWAKLTAGSWVTIAGQTASSLVVNGTDVDGMASYRCQMTYSSVVYTDIVSLIDKSDNYQVTIDSSGGDVFKNTIGDSNLIARVWQNGVETDGLKTTYISNVSPASPTAGMFWYKLDKVAKTVVLQKYSGSAWANATGADLHTLTYTWYRLDKNGASTLPTPFKLGKVVFIDGNDVDVKATFYCEVSK